MKSTKHQNAYYKRRTVGRLKYYFIFTLMAMSGFYNLYFLLERAFFPGQVLGKSEYIIEKVEVPVEVVKDKIIMEEYTPSHMSQKQQIMHWIIEVFGDKADEAIKIASCESGFNPNTVGDSHLMSHNKQTGEWIGDSIGIFQVRTGDTDWNRAKANGMTVEEFRTWMKDPKANIEYAKTIYDRAGSWSPWFNCMRKNGLN